MRQSGLGSWHPAPHNPSDWCISIRSALGAAGWHCSLGLLLWGCGMATGRQWGCAHSGLQMLLSIHWWFSRGWDCSSLRVCSEETMQVLEGCPSATLWAHLSHPLFLCPQKHCFVFCHFSSRRYLPGKDENLSLEPYNGLICSTAAPTGLHFKAVIFAVNWRLLEGAWCSWWSPSCSWGPSIFISSIWLLVLTPHAEMWGSALPPSSGSSFSSCSNFPPLMIPSIGASNYSY